jgi:hypothetical protein
MFDLSGVFVILIFIFLVIIALAVALKLLGLSLSEDTAGGQQAGTPPAPGDEGRFLASFLQPIYDDGLDEMENAVDEVRDGLDFYGHGACVEAGEAFIAARRSLDAAARKFREVRTLVEDPQVEHAIKARSRLDECQRLAEMAEAMENACDATLEGREAEARALEDKASGLRKLTEEWKKE